MYGNLADYRAYALERGNSAPTDAGDADAMASLVRASDYIRTRYVLRLDGLEGTSSAVVEATYIAAALDLANPGFWAKTYTPNEAKVLTKVEGLQWTATDAGVEGPDAFLPVSPAIDALMRPLGGYGAAVMVV